MNQVDLCESKSLAIQLHFEFAINSLFRFNSRYSRAKRRKRRKSKKIYITICLRNENQEKNENVFSVSMSKFQQI